MTAAASQPALAGDQAATLLDRLVYEQVLACIDLDELYHLEQSIALLAGELDGIGEAQASALARAMLDSALARLPDDLRRYLRAEWIDLTDCPLCEDEASDDEVAEAAATADKAAGGGAGEAATRGKAKTDDKAAHRRPRPSRWPVG